MRRCAADDDDERYQNHRDDDERRDCAREEDEGILTEIDKALNSGLKALAYALAERFRRRERLCHVAHLADRYVRGRILDFVVVYVALPRQRFYHICGVGQRVFKLDDVVHFGGFFHQL